MTAATLDGRVFEPSPLRPPWLRPAVIAIVIALHAAALSIVYLEPQPIELPREVVVDIQTEAPPTEAVAPPAEQPKPAERSAPPPAQDAAPAPTEPPPPPIPLTPPVAEQPPLPAEEPLPQPPPETLPQPPAPVELARPPPPPPKPAEVPRPRPASPLRVEAPRAQPRLAPKPAPRPAQAQSRAAAAPAQISRSASSTSAPSSAAANPSSLSAYIGEVSAAIRSRLFYPPAARARGAQGVVGVSFTIGPSGAVNTFAITRSSGDRDLDAAARSLVQGGRFPPPPGGSAHIATSFNYVPR